MTTSTQTTDTNAAVAAKAPRKPRANYRLLSHFDADLYGLKVETVEQGKVTDTAILWAPERSIDIDAEYVEEQVTAIWKGLVLRYSGLRYAMDTRKDMPATLSAAETYMKGSESDALLEAIDASLPKEKESRGKAAESLQLALLVNELRAELAAARKENLELTRRLMSFLERNSA